MVRVFDETTRQLITTLGGGETGHSNRVQCVKFDPNDPNFVISGGWDRTVIVWDLRLKTAVRHFYGPSVGGDSIDLSNEVIMTGSKNTEEPTMQMWEYTTCEHFTDINWDEGLPSEKKCAIYCLQFEKNNGDIVIAGGGGSNEVKVFDGDMEFKPCAQIKDLSRGVYTLDWSNSGDCFAFGGKDGVIRVFNVVKEV